MTLQLSNSYVDKNRSQTLQSSDNQQISRLSSSSSSNIRFVPNSLHLTPQEKQLNARVLQLNERKPQGTQPEQNLNEPYDVLKAVNLAKDLLQQNQKLLSQIRNFAKKIGSGNYGTVFSITMKYLDKAINIVQKLNHQNKNNSDISGIDISDINRALEFFANYSLLLYIQEAIFEINNDTFLSGGVNKLALPIITKEQEQALSKAETLADKIKIALESEIFKREGLFFESKPGSSLESLIGMSKILTYSPKARLKLVLDLLMAASILDRAGIAHRDFNYGNILIDENGPTAYLIDLGLALNLNTLEVYEGKLEDFKKLKEGNFIPNEVLKNGWTQENQNCNGYGIFTIMPAILFGSGGMEFIYDTLEDFSDYGKYLNEYLDTSAKQDTSSLEGKIASLEAELQLPSPETVEQPEVSKTEFWEQKIDFLEKRLSAIKTELGSTQEGNSVTKKEFKKIRSEFDDLKNKIDIPFQKSPKLPRLLGSKVSVIFEYNATISEFNAIIDKMESIEQEMETAQGANAVDLQKRYDELDALYDQLDTKLSELDRKVEEAQKSVNLVTKFKDEHKGNKIYNDVITQNQKRLSDEWANCIRSCNEQLSRDEKFDEHDLAIIIMMGQMLGNSNSERRSTAEDAGRTLFQELYPSNTETSPVTQNSASIEESPFNEQITSTSNIEMHHSTSSDSEISTESLEHLNDVTEESNQIKKIPLKNDRQESGYSSKESFDSWSLSDPSTSNEY